MSSVNTHECKWLTESSGDLSWRTADLRCPDDAPQRSTLPVDRADSAWPRRYR